MHFFSIFPKHSEFPGVIQNTWKIQHLTSKIFLEASKNIQARMGLIHGPIQYSIWRKSSGNHGLGYLFKVYTFTRLKRTDKIKLMLCLFLLLGVKKELYFFLSTEFFLHVALWVCIFLNLARNYFWILLFCYIDQRCQTTNRKWNQASWYLS